MRKKQTSRPSWLWYFILSHRLIYAVTEGRKKHRQVSHQSHKHIHTLTQTLTHKYTLTQIPWLVELPLACRRSLQDLANSLASLVPQLHKLAADSIKLVEHRALPNTICRAGQLTLEVGQRS